MANKKTPTAETQPVNPSLLPIDALAEKHAADRKALTDEMLLLDEEIKAVKDRHHKKIQALAAAFKVSHKALNDALLKAPTLFVAPRTHVMHGLKVGYRKPNGKTIFGDEQKSIALIKTLMPEKVSLLIASTESIVIDACSQLSAAELKSIGGCITGTLDQVVIAPTVSDAEKMVNSFLKEMDK